MFLNCIVCRDLTYNSIIYFILFFLQLLQLKTEHEAELTDCKKCLEAEHKKQLETVKEVLERTQTKEINNLQKIHSKDMEEIKLGLFCFCLQTFYQLSLSKL